MTEEPTLEADREPVPTESDPDLADATYGWGSYDCGRCGSATDRVWEGDEGLVCPDCKEWSSTPL